MSSHRSFVPIESLESRLLMHDGPHAETSWLINAGGAAYASTLGQKFLADQLVVGGTGKTGSFAIDKTVNDKLYSDRRFGSNFSYELPVVNGTYSLKLYFAETYFTTAGKRKFDVFAEGKQLLNDFDIVGSSGAFSAVTKTFAMNVIDGHLNVQFKAVVDNAIVSAIEATLTKASEPTPEPPPPPSSGTLSWTTKANAPVKLSEGAGVTIASKLYVFGGYDVTSPKYQATSRVSAYDPATNMWSNAAPMPLRLTHIGLTTDGQRYAYVAGGYRTNADGNQTFAVNNVYRFDVINNTWLTLPNLPAARGAGAMQLVDGKLFYFGGVSADRVDRTNTYVLNLNNTAAGWTEKAALPAMKNHLASATVGGLIYAIGGQIGTNDSTGNQSTVYRYDPTANQWTAVASLPQVRSHIGGSTFVHNGKIFVAGGFSASGLVLSSVISYDPLTNKWTSIGNMPASRHSSVGGSVGGKIIVTGGYNAGLSWQTWVA